MTAHYPITSEAAWDTGGWLDEHPPSDSARPLTVQCVVLMAGVIFCSPKCSSSSAAAAWPPCSPSHSAAEQGDPSSYPLGGVARHAGRWGWGSLATTMIGAQKMTLATCIMCCAVSGPVESGDGCSSSWPPVPAGFVCVYKYDAPISIIY